MRSALESSPLAADRSGAVRRRRSCPPKACPLTRSAGIVDSDLPERAGMSLERRGVTCSYPCHGWSSATAAMSGWTPDRTSARSSSIQFAKTAARSSAGSADASITCTRHLGSFASQPLHRDHCISPSVVRSWITSVSEVGSAACERIQAAHASWSASSLAVRSNHSGPRARSRAARVASSQSTKQAEMALSSGAEGAASSSPSGVWPASSKSIPAAW